MRISITPKSSLDERFIITLSERVAASEHAFDNGSCKIWSTPSYLHNIYAIIETQLQVPIGILYADGHPNNIDVAWWLDSRYRGKGYASEAVDLFATYLKFNGITGVGHISIDTFQGKYHEASCKLVARFKAHFS
jgi:RimJ/RimL family protein N-acetyltransferase